MKLIGKLGAHIAPPRFILFAIVLLLGSALATALETPFWVALLAGFHLAATAFLVSLIPLRSDKAADMRATAAANDANRISLLAITVLILVVVLIAVGTLIGEDAKPDWEVPLVIVTLTMAWLFANAVFALHYAHIFYRQSDGKDQGGLSFPDIEAPDYLDFLYFSVTLGMTFQTSDVSIESQHFRRVVLIHTMAAFAFNIGILAYCINIVGGQS